MAHSCFSCKHTTNINRIVIRLQINYFSNFFVVCGLKNILTISFRASIIKNVKNERNKDVLTVQELEKKHCSINDKVTDNTNKSYLNPLTSYIYVCKYLNKCYINFMSILECLSTSVVCRKICSRRN